MPLNYDRLIAEVQGSLATAVNIQDTALTAHLQARQHYEEASNRVTSLTSLVTVLTELKSLEEKITTRMVAAIP